MDGTLVAPRYADMVDDRPDDGVFRVSRDVYIDEAVFDAEMRNIFESNWVFVCHESQAEKPGDYFSCWIGRQPIYVHRQKDGSLAGFINACSHRAAILTPFRQGNARVLTCRFHGWAYDAEGNCIKVKNEETGWPEGCDKSQFDLKRVPRLESYGGFVFGSLNPDVEPLEDFLAGAARWIDLFNIQAPEGIEVVAGSSTYVIDGNWKYQLENSVDGYHVSTVHRVFASTISNRQSKGEYTGMAKTEAGRIAGEVPSGAYYLGNGHMSIWAKHTTPEVRPIYERKEQIEAEATPAECEWIFNRGRNLCLWPNVMLMDNPSTQIRYLRPISPSRAEVTVYCIAPKGESKKARAARLRKFEDFYLTAGMATSDDMAALEGCQDGSWGRTAPWNEFTRGVGEELMGADEDAKALGFEPEISCPNWDHEVFYHGFYRNWLTQMTREGAAK